MGFVFMNHYMDIFEAIENGRPDTRGMDYTEFEGTDIPAICALPNYHLVSSVDHEDAQEWILSISMDRNIFPVKYASCYYCFAGWLYVLT